MTPHFRAILLLTAVAVAFIFAPILAFATDAAPVPRPEVAKLSEAQKEKCEAEGGCIVVTRAWVMQVDKAARADQMRHIVNDMPVVHDEFGHCRLGGA